MTIEKSMSLIVPSLLKSPPEGPVPNPVGVGVPLPRELVGVGVGGVLEMVNVSTLVPVRLLSTRVTVIFPVIALAQTLVVIMVGLALVTAQGPVPKVTVNLALQ